MLSVLYRLADSLRHRARLRSGNAAHAWGRRGEDLAHRHLRSRGYTVIGRNYRTLNGSAEVDLIARYGDTTVFIEVKTRASEEYGSPDSAVDAEKRRKIRRAAMDFLRLKGDDTVPVRFDIINVVFGDGDAIQIEHLEDAFSARLADGIASGSRI